MASALARTSPTDEHAPRAYYSISQAAAVLGVSRVTIWRWVSAGHMPVSRLGHRTVRIHRDDIDRLVEQRLTSHTAAALKLPSSDCGQIATGEHVAQFYEADAFLLEAVSHYLLPALRSGDAAVVVATPAHLVGIEERLRAAGDIDLDGARARGQYLSLDAHGLLSRFMVDGEPDAGQFCAIVGEIIDNASDGGRRVRVFGEMVAVLASEGRHGAAVALEELWNDLQRSYQFSLFCAYPIEYFSGHELGRPLEDVCTAHGRVVPTESYTALRGADDQLRAVAALQHKAQSLKTEVARREIVEDQLRVALASERAARESAEAALRLRDEFMSIASHELKTPLTTLSGYAQLVLRRFRRDGELDSERAVQALQAITGQADKLGRLMGHLLDVSRLEEGRLKLEPTRFDVVGLVEHQVSTAGVWSDKHPISLVAPAVLEAALDALRFEQVVSNLLDNAVKYSPDGGAVDVVLAERGASFFELSVRDHGLGIPRERRAHIFERFYQAHMGGHRSGLGLGLYISRQIVELHGGQIRVEFPPDGGTRFIVRMPLGD
jgi:excisionase family DNA binding protein